MILDTGATEVTNSNYNILMHSPGLQLLQPPKTTKFPSANQSINCHCMHAYISVYLYSTFKGLHKGTKAPMANT